MKNNDLLAQLAAVTVSGKVDLGELDGAYKGVVFSVRLNCSRALKDLQREARTRTLEIQLGYSELAELSDDRPEWTRQRQELKRAEDENWDQWAEFWSGMLMISIDEVKQVNSVLPERHWLWLTAQALLKADQYEVGLLKKADDARAGSLGKRAG